MTSPQPHLVSLPVNSGIWGRQIDEELRSVEGKAKASSVCVLAWQVTSAVCPKIRLKRQKNSHPQLRVREMNGTYIYKKF